MMDHSRIIYIQRQQSCDALDYGLAALGWQLCGPECVWCVWGGQVSDDVIQAETGRMRRTRSKRQEFS